MKNTNKCEKHRTISLISHASKISLKALGKRLMEKTKDYIGKDQFGFMKGRSTRDAIATLHVIIEKLLEHGKDLFVCFVDFEKAFDRVNWIKLMEILKNVGVDYRDRRMICELYMNQSAEVIIGEEISEAAEIGRGVRQGRLLSTILFNIYVEFMLMEALEDCEDGVNVGGERLAAVRYADDQAIIVITNVGLQHIMDRLVEGQWNKNKNHENFNKKE